MKTSRAYTKAARCRSSLPSGFSAVRLGPYNNWIQAVYRHYLFTPAEPVWVDRFVARRLSFQGQSNSMGVLLAYLFEYCLGTVGFSFLVSAFLLE